MTCKPVNTGTGIALGMGLGVAIGVATGHMGMWIAVGIAIGYAFANHEQCDSPAITNVKPQSPPDSK